MCRKLSKIYCSNSRLFYIKALLQAIDVLKREVQRQREEKEVLEANVREQVVSEMMEVISRMQDGFRCVCVGACLNLKCQFKGFFLVILFSGKEQ